MKALGITIIIALFIGAFLGVIALLWLAYNHGVAPALGVRTIGYWPFVGCWMFLCAVVRLLKSK